MSTNNDTTATYEHDNAGPREPAALTAAPRGRLRHCVRDSIRADVARRYERDGISIRGIAAEIDRSYSLVRRLLIEADVPLRPPAHHRATG